MKLELGVHHLFEFLALLVSIAYQRKLKNSYMYAFIPFLAIILLLEITSNFLYLNYKTSTLFLSQISNIVSVSFFSFLFSVFFEKTKLKTIVTILTGLYLLVTVFCWIQFGLTRPFFSGLIVGSGFIMIFYSGLLFYQYLQNDDVILTPRALSSLWITAGILFFYSGIELVIAAIPYIEANQLKFFGVPLYNTIPRLLSILLYSCISISVYIWRPQTN